MKFRHLNSIAQELHRSALLYHYNMDKSKLSTWPRNNIMHESWTTTKPQRISDNIAATSVVTYCCIGAACTTWCSQHHWCWIFCLHLSETPVVAWDVCFTPSTWPRADRTMDHNFTNCNQKLSGLCCAKRLQGMGAHIAMPSSTLLLLQPWALGPKWLLIKEQKSDQQPFTHKVYIALQAAIIYGKCHLCSVMLS